MKRLKDNTMKFKVVVENIYTSIVSKTIYHLISCKIKQTPLNQTGGRDKQDVYTKFSPFQVNVIKTGF